MEDIFFTDGEDNKYCLRISNYTNFNNEIINGYFTNVLTLKSDDSCKIPHLIENKDIELLEKIVEIINKKFAIKVRWRAENNNIYFFLDSFNEVKYNFEMNDIADNKRYKLGNYFKTEEEAKIISEKFKEFWNDIIKEKTNK